MKRSIALLILSWLMWLAVFAVGKVGFMLYNGGTEAFGAGDVLDVLRHGLSMDMTTAGYLVAVPWLVLLVGFGVDRWRASRRRPTKPRQFLWTRRVLTAYYVIIGPIVAFILCADAFLYEFWKFKLNVSFLAYASELQGATNSVSMAYSISRIAAIIVVAVLMTALFVVVLRRLLKDSIPEPFSLRRTLLGVLAFLLFGAADALAIRGGIGASVQNVGTAYYSQRLFLNHSAVNPVFSLVSSISHSQDFASQYRYSDDAEVDAIVADLYTPTTTAPADTLLHTTRPDILIVVMEGFGSRFVEALGGIPDVAPHFNRLVNEGVFFDNYYSNSFRTDRGTVSLFSGWPSYPTVSLMKIPEKAALAPGLGRSLAAAGYSTDFVYGGDIDFTGTAGYLVGAGFEHLVSDRDFPISEVHSSKWGASDAVTAERVGDMIAAKRKNSLPSDRDSQPAGQNSQPSAPWCMGYLTLSSHEPFEVPYSRLDDKVLNAFAYTDECIGRLIDRLKASPAWANLLVVLVPDHGFLYDLTYEDAAFFHCPMLWLGGAVKEPRRVSTLMNQSDLCATLLGQLRLPHDDFPWSRDIFSPDYREPFVYCTSPSTVMYADSTGTTIYDIEANRVVSETPKADAHASLRLRRAKAILQHTYRSLDAMR